MSRPGSCTTYPSNASAPTKTESESYFEIVRPFVEKIEAAQAKGIEAIMHLADALIEARNDLKPRGLYYRLFADSKDQLGCAVSMTSATADKITSIRERKGLSDPSTWKGLPSSWTCLYELSNLELADVRRLVEDGSVTPETTVKEAHSLVLDLYPKDAPKSKRNTTSTIEPDEPDWRDGLGEGSVNINVSEQVALLVQQHHGLLPTPELRKRDIALCFKSARGIRIDKLAQDIAEAQGLDEREVQDKILDALDHRSAIWREDERQAMQRKEPVKSVPTAKSRKPLKKSKSKTQIRRDEIEARKVGKQVESLCAVIEAVDFDRAGDSIFERVADMVEHYRKTLHLYPDAVGPLAIAELKSATNRLAERLEVYRGFLAAVEKVEAA